MSTQEQKALVLRRAGVGSRSTRTRKGWCKMYYLYVDTKIICKWCSSSIMNVIEDSLEHIVVRLCPVCDRWPPALLRRADEDGGSGGN